MSAKEFDELIKDKLGQPDFAYLPEDYRAMNKQLIAARQGRTSRKIFFWLTSIAACMLIGIAISALTGNNVYKGELATKKETAQAGSSQNAVPSIAAPQKEANAPINKENRVALDQKKASTKQNVAPQPNDLPGITMQKLIAGKNEQNAKASDKPVFNGRLDNINLAQNVPTSSLTPRSPYYAIVPRPTEETDDPYSRKVNISLAGGVNYGSANQGYLLGASARKNLGDKLYVEGDIAYTNSSTQRTVSTYSAPTSTVNGVFSPAPTISSKENASSLNYLQLSPGAGYHIHKKIAVGVAADLQRLLQNNAPTTSSTVMTNGISSETGKIMPELDYGFIGKTEYSVSSRLKAGLQYREGLNNFLSNTNKYFDRNYFQVQVKYSLFNK